MRTAAATALATLLLFAAGPTDSAAQDLPDFSGTWTISESSGGPPAGARGAGQRGGGMMMGGGGLGQEATVIHDGGTLTIVRSTPMGEMRSVYNLDGSDSPNTMRMGDNEREIVSRASWEDHALVIVTPMMMGGGAGESRMTLSLDGDGHLVVQTARGGGMGGGGTMRATYVRK